MRANPLELIMEDQPVSLGKIGYVDGERQKRPDEIFRKLTSIALDHQVNDVHSSHATGRYSEPFKILFK